MIRPYFSVNSFLMAVSGSFKTIAQVSAGLILLTGLWSQSVLAGSTVTHGLSKYGALKYDADFTHFEYVNPDAPKGGDIVLSSSVAFDSLNAFILKGVQAAGIGLIYESLMTGSDDEPSAYYGSIAESAEVDDDTRWVIFNLRKQARWHDGKAITADDVVFSFETLLEKGHPFYKSYYSDVAKVEKLESHKVKFQFKQGNNPELPLIVAQLTILPKHYYEDRDFGKTTLEAPLGSGAYRVADIDPGRSITYELVDDYWAADLPVNKGRNNYNSMRYDTYRELTISLEALKAGDIDFRTEYISKDWATAYNFPALNDGRVIKEDIPDGNIQRTQAIVMNLRQDRFKDVRVRKAMDLVYDFEWMNKNLFYGAYQRNDSYFQIKEMNASGLPEGDELALLETYRDQLPASVFTDVYTPPTGDGSGRIRKRFREAIKLLKEAGWEVRDQKLTHIETGEKFVIEFLFRQASLEKIILAYKKNLERLGIELKPRLVDTAQWVKRLEEFDFDMTTQVMTQSLSPGNEQRDFFSSEAAVTGGTRNVAGIENPVVDELVETMISAPSREETLVAVRALDRVMKQNHYVIFMYYGDTHRVAYWNKFVKPDLQPKYALGFDTWWVDEEKEKALE